MARHDASVRQIKSATDPTRRILVILIVSGFSSVAANRADDVVPYRWLLLSRSIPGRSRKSIRSDPIAFPMVRRREEVEVERSNLKSSSIEARCTNTVVARTYDRRSTFRDYRIVRMAFVCVGSSRDTRVPPTLFFFLLVLRSRRLHEHTACLVKINSVIIEKKPGNWDTRSAEDHCRESFISQSTDSESLSLRSSKRYCLPLSRAIYRRKKQPIGR